MTAVQSAHFRWQQQRNSVMSCLLRVARGHTRSNSERRSNCFARTGGAGVRVLGRAVMPRLLNDRGRRRVGDALFGAAAFAAVVRFAEMVIV